MHIKQVVLTVVWKVLADIQSLCLCYSVSCLVMHLAQRLWKTSTLWTIPWVEPWVIFHVIKSHPSVIQNDGTSSFSVLISSAQGWSPWSFCISYTCATIFNLSIHSNIIHFGKALFPYRTKSFWWILAPGIPSAHINWINACCSFWSTEKPH